MPKNVSKETIRRIQRATTIKGGKKPTERQVNEMIANVGANAKASKFLKGSRKAARAIRKFLK